MQDCGGCHSQNSDYMPASNKEKDLHSQVLRSFSILMEKAEGQELSVYLFI